MDGVFGRLYARLSRIYWLTFVVFAVFLAAVLPAIFVFLALVMYLGIPIQDAVSAILLSVGAIEVTTMIGLALEFRLSRPVLAWIKGERTHENAAAAWAAAVRMPSLHPVVFPAPLLAGATVCIVAIARAGRPSPIALVAAGAGGLVVVALGIAIHMVAAGAILRPVLTEIDAKFPSSSAGARVKPSSLRPRIVRSSLLVVISSAWLAAGLAARATTPSQTLTLAIASGLGIGIIFGLILTTALTQSMFDPLRQLAEATRRVQEGDMTTRVPLVANDEIGELSRSFRDGGGPCGTRCAPRRTRCVRRAWDRRTPDRGRRGAEGPGGRGHDHVRGHGRI